MTIRPAWFARSLPHDWHGGRIKVDGDVSFQQEAIRVARLMATVILGAACAYAFVVLVFAL